MPDPMRSIAALFLCVILTLASHSTAVARGASADLEQIEICSGGAVIVIYLDSQGQPAQVHHVCPECLATWAGPPETRDGFAAGTLCFSYDRSLAGRLGFAQPQMPGFSPRAPPRFV